MTVADAAATRSVLLATLVALGISALVPSLWWLYTTFERFERSRAG